MRAVTERLARLEHVEIWQETFTIDLLTLNERLPRHHRLEPGARQDAGLGQANDPGHRRGRADLPRNDQSDRGHGRRTGPGLSRGGRAARRRVRAVPPYGPVHRRRQPQPDQRGHPRRGRAPGRSPRPSLHARLRSPRRAGPPRRRQSFHRQPDGEDAASERLSRYDASRSAAGLVAVPGHCGDLCGVRSGHHPRPHSRCGRVRIT